MKKRIRLFSVILLFLLGISAMAGGWALIGDPSGRSLGWEVDMLRYSPFKNYFIPGVILFVVNGISSLVIAIVVIKEVRNFAFLIIMQGCLLIGWIVIQVILIWQFNLLHAICLATGILLVACGNSLLNRSQEEQVDNYRI